MITTNKTLKTLPPPPVMTARRAKKEVLKNLQKLDTLEMLYKPDKKSKK